MAVGGCAFHLSGRTCSMAVGGCAFHLSGPRDGGRGAQTLSRRETTTSEVAPLDFLKHFAPFFSWALHGAFPGRLNGTTRPLKGHCRL